MGTGSSVSKETRVKKKVALAAVDAAFSNESHDGSKVSIGDIARAVPSTAVDVDLTAEHYKTTFHRMHEWRKSPHRVRPPPRKAVLPPVVHVGSPGTYTHGSGIEYSSDVLHWTNVLSSGKISRDDRMKKIRTMFDALDSDHSGVVLKDEFISFLATEGIGKQEAQALFNEMDSNRSGKLTVAKLDSYCAIRTMGMVASTFHRLDKSHDRQIRKAEFKAYFMGNGLSKHQVNTLWGTMDKNQNGKINFVEYREWARDNLERADITDICIDLGLSQP